MSKVSDTSVDKLVASSSISADVVKEAAQKNADAQREQQIETARTALRDIQTQVDAQVQVVRDSRRAERTASERLRTLAAAAEEFKASGNLEAFAKALYPNSPGDAQYWLRRYPTLTK